MTDSTTDATDDSAASTAADQPLLKPSLTEFPWLRAALASVGTLVVQYAAIVVALALSGSAVTRADWSLWEKAVQYVYVVYSAHHVPISTTVSQGVQAGSGLNNLLYGQPFFPAVLFFALPVVVLLAAGFLFERQRTPPVTVGGTEESAMVATGFAIPYVAVGALGSFVFVRRITGETAQAVSAPALLWTLVAMFLFPMAFVAIGAALAYVFSTPGQA